jgi:uncharacterized protein (TIGR02246 family)
MTRRLLLTFGILAMSACASAPEANAPQDIAALGAVRDGFVKAFNAGDANAIGALYTTDAIAMPGHNATLSGQSAIVAYNKGLFGQMNAKIEVTPDETRTMGNFGFDRGRYRMTMTPKAGGPEIADEGRYIVMLERDAKGSWKVTRDIDNSSLAMPAPAPPPAHPAPAKAKPKPKGKGKGK